MTAVAFEPLTREARTAWFRSLTDERAAFLGADVAGPGSFALVQHVMLATRPARDQRFHPPVLPRHSTVWRCAP
jgi:hypothetical protein